VNYWPDISLDEYINLKEQGREPHGDRRRDGHR
jgi:hypothetical protein